jgi:hypothetical protein
MEALHLALALNMEDEVAVLCRPKEEMDCKKRPCLNYCCGFDEEFMVKSGCVVGRSKPWQNTFSFKLETKYLEELLS